MISRLELLVDLNIVRCDRDHCAYEKIDAVMAALEVDDLKAITDGDSTVGLTITSQGRSHMKPVLPWSAA
jgi:hypothetical protein